MMENTKVIMMRNTLAILMRNEFFDGGDYRVEDGGDGAS
jgi:hypothetical protein